MMLPETPFDLMKALWVMLAVLSTPFLLIRFSLKWTLLSAIVLILFFGYYGFLTNSFLLVLLFLSTFALRVYLKPSDKNSFLFILPFSLPFLIISPLMNFIPAEYFLVYSIAIMLALFAFFPFIVQSIWRSTPLKETELKNDLNALCEKARFKHGGLLEWKILPHMLTAGIMGVIPRFRYVMFTPSLLRHLQPAAIKAILAHELGHHKYKHLYFFPVILLSLLLTANSLLYLSGIEEPFFQTLLFIVIAAFYYRFVFGYFSRLFERQADLNALSLDIPLDDMILALDEVGNFSGGSHKNPSWHHFSIQERIDFLNRVKRDVKLANKHHFKTLISVGFLFLYTAFLILL